MPEQKEAVSFNDNIVITPVELCRDREVDGDAIACFAIMKSFGPRAEAKVETYAARARWPVARIRKAQKTLLDAKWIILLREGQRIDKDTYITRLWYMCRFKGQEAPQGLALGVTDSEPLSEKGLRKKGSLKVGLPKNGGAKAVEGSSSSRRNDQAIERAAADAAFEAFWGKFKQKNCKIACRKAWDKLSPSNQELAAITRPIYEAETLRKIPDATLKYGQGWLNERRFEEVKIPAAELKGAERCKARGHAWEKVWDDHDASQWTGKHKCSCCGEIR